jgi:hypothetical protein
MTRVTIFGTTEIKRPKNLIELAVARVSVSETRMPHIAGVLNIEIVVAGGTSGGFAQWVEFAGRITSEQNRPR